jgi:hypothetical protein
MVTDKLPISIEIDGGLVGDEVDQQFSLADLPPAVERDELRLVPVPSALQLGKFVDSVEEHQVPALQASYG